MAVGIADPEAFEQFPLGDVYGTRTRDGIESLKAIEKSLRQSLDSSLQLMPSGQFYFLGSLPSRRTSSTVELPRGDSGRIP